MKSRLYYPAVKCQKSSNFLSKKLKSFSISAKKLVYNSFKNKIITAENALFEETFNENFTIASIE